MSTKAGHNLRVGDRVKLTAFAFDNGVYPRNVETRAYRGTVLRRTRRDSEIIVVEWDHKRTHDQLYQGFLMKAGTAASR